MNTCRHVQKVRLSSNHSVLDAQKWTCAVCSSSEDIWACLSCSHVGCGKYIEEHIKLHYNATKHPISMNVSQKYVYCYECDNYVLNDNAAGDVKILRNCLQAVSTQQPQNIQPNNPQHLNHSSSTVSLNEISCRRSNRVQKSSSNIIASLLQMTPKNMMVDNAQDVAYTELWFRRYYLLAHFFNKWKLKSSNLQCGVSLESDDTEDDSTSTPKKNNKRMRWQTSPVSPVRSSKKRKHFIPGAVGLQNLGNTCYMNSILQVLRHLSQFSKVFIEENANRKINNRGSTSECLNANKPDNNGFMKLHKKDESTSEDDNRNVSPLATSAKQMPTNIVLQDLDTIDTANVLSVSSESADRLSVSSSTISPSSTTSYSATSLTASQIDDCISLNEPSVTSLTDETYAINNEQETKSEVFLAVPTNTSLIEIVTEDSCLRNHLNMSNSCIEVCGGKLSMEQEGLETRQPATIDSSIICNLQHSNNSDFKICVNDAENNTLENYFCNVENKLVPITTSHDSSCGLQSNVSSVESSSDLASKDVNTNCNNVAVTTNPVVKKLKASRKRTPTKLSLSHELNSLLRIMWSGKMSMVSPHKMLYAVWNIIPFFRGYSQQDAQEFLSEFLDKVQSEIDIKNSKNNHINGKSNYINDVIRNKEEVVAAYQTNCPLINSNGNNSSTKHRNSNQECNSSDSNKYNNGCVALNNTNMTEDIVTQLFQGELISQVHCLTCGYHSSRKEAFMDLSLEFPIRFHTRTGSNRINSLCKLEEMLRQFMRIEKLDGKIYACEQCNSCTSDGASKEVTGPTIYTEAEKRFLINKLPSVLRLHLKRFMWSGRSSKGKISVNVAFPHRLDVSEFCHPDVITDSFQYNLSAVVMHHGRGFGSGHYTAYCWNNDADSWLHCNDAKMQKATLEDVQKAQAYILVYTKLPSHSHNANLTTSATSNKRNNATFSESSLLCPPEACPSSHMVSKKTTSRRSRIPKFADASRRLRVENQGLFSIKRTQTTIW